MENSKEQDTRIGLLKLQLEKESNVVSAQKIVLKHLEDAIQSGHSATVAAMAEILKV